MADDVLEQCPRAVMDANISWDTLTVNVPYEGVNEHPVSVPPLVPNNDFGLWLLGNYDLTTPGGEMPQEWNADQYIVGWDKGYEKDERDELRSKADGIIALADAGDLHPQAKDPVRKLAVSARDDLNRIRSIYDTWQNSRVATRPDNSPFSMRQMYGASAPIGLNLQWKDVYYWMVYPEDARAHFDAFESILAGERGGWTIGDPTPENFHAAMRNARRKARDRIRQLLRAAYRKVWCAEYGVAQTESHDANKAEWDKGPGRYTLPGGPKIVARPGGPPPPDYPQMTLVEWALPPEPPDGGLGGTGEPPPVAGPGVATRWYQTTAGKVGIAAATLAVAGAVGYGIWYWRRSAA